MKKVPFLTLSFILLASIAVVAKDVIYLGGRVKESFGKTDLCNAYVLLYDSIGNVTDSIRTNMGRRIRNGEESELAFFYFQVPRKDSTIVFDVVCEGYIPQTISYRLENIGKRERSRELPMIFMERAPRQLKELTVTTSKIKFYNKGDTIVFNADAFQLAEGSMLDGLISQLPGVELDDKGRIKVNGEFVESLLLNGKEFFDGDNNLMLENIAAYTVKNVEVYKGRNKDEKYLGDRTAPEHLTMDVKLKREYNVGWLINAQGGYGTEDRYLGRLFASWFNPTTQVSLVTNFNNLNDNRTPGKNDTWTPEQMPSGKMKYKMAGINYQYENAEETRSVGGNFLFRQTANNSSTSTSRTNFLPDGETYDYSYNGGYRRETNIKTMHFIRTRSSKVGFLARGSGEYVHHKKSSSGISGTFNSEQQDMTRDMLEALYSAGTPDLLDDVLNRSIIRNDGWLKHLHGNFMTSTQIKMPGSEDDIMFAFAAKYEDQKEEFWTGQDINYGSDATPAYKLRHFTDYSPNHALELNGKVGYQLYLRPFNLSLQYDFWYTDRKRDSYMYALERLNDMGIYGQLPDGYLAAFDPANSYRSHQKDYVHSITPLVMVGKVINDDSRYMLSLRPVISFTRRTLDYWRDNRDHHIVKSNTSVAISHRMFANFEYSFRKRDRQYVNNLEYSYTIEPTLPELTDMIDFVSDADPLNVFRGNPNLKAQLRQSHSISWSFRPYKKPVSNKLSYSISYTDNALTRGYTYDTSTGVRNTSVYNVDGNRSHMFSNYFSWQFGTKKQFSLSSTTDLNLSRYADMVGINLNAPSLQKVNNTTYGEKLNLSWQIGSQMLQLRADYYNRRTSSDREDFNTINARHFNYGLTGSFKLPGGFGISTDFICYTRRGYGVDYLDTTDPIWNVRLSYNPQRYKRLVFMLDGFDMLHKLSNVNYAVTATGRTVTYTNTLPRYLLLTVQYRLSIQPKKR